MNILLINHRTLGFCQGWRGKKEEGGTLRCLQVDDADDNDTEDAHDDDDDDSDDDDDEADDDADGVDDAQVGVSSWMLEGRGSLQ